jgi:hypothetical protein
MVEITQSDYEQIIKIKTRKYMRLGFTQGVAEQKALIDCTKQYTIIETKEVD